MQSSAEIFKKAYKDKNFALDLYNNQSEIFHSLSIIQRAHLAEANASLLEAIIKNPVINVEDITAITSTYPDGVDVILGSGLVWKSAIATFLDAALIMHLDRAPEILRRLNSKTQ